MKVDDLDVVAAADRGLLEEWAVGLDALLGELIGCGSSWREPRVRALAYVKALLSQVETRNGWTVAEAAGEKTPAGMQRLLNDAVWDEAGVREDLRSYVVTHLGADDGVLVFDETGDIKQGNHTVGVARQYTGVTGQVENCQVSVHAGYVSSRGQALIDTELYLPDAYAHDSERCAEAGVPAERAGVVITKGDLAAVMFGRAVAAGMPFSYVAGDEVYGRSTNLRSAIETTGGCGYVLEVGCDLRVCYVPGDKLRVDALPAEVPRWAGNTAAKAMARKGCATTPCRTPLDSRDCPPGWRRSLLIRRDPDDTAAAEHSSRKNSKNNKAGKNGKSGADGKGDGIPSDAGGEQYAYFLCYHRLTTLVFRRFCGSCPSGGPGCEDGLGFLRGGLLRAWAAKSRGDDDPAELDGHVVVGRFGLRGVPAGPSPVPDDVTGAVTVQGVPDGDHAKTDQPERHGPLHGATCPIAGFAHPDDLAGVGEGLLDSPARCVAGHQVFGRGFEIGGHQRKPVTAIVTVASPRFVIAHQDHAHGLAAKRSVPETDHLGDPHDVGASVPADPCLAPPARQRGAGGKVGGCAQPGPSGAGPPGPSRARWWQLVQHRGDLQPTGPRDPVLEVAEAFSHVGGVPDHVHDPVGVAGGDQLGQLARVGDLPGVPGSPQPGQHRQTHRAGQKRQLHHDAGHHPAVAETDGFRALRRPVVMPRHPEYFLAGPLEQRVVDRDRERRIRWEQSGHDQIGQGQSERITRPAGVGEQSVGAAVMPHLLQPGTGEHSTHRSTAGLRDQTDNQPDERMECRGGKARAELGQQTGQRARCGGAGKHRRITLTRTVKERSMLSSSPSKIHEPLVIGVSPRPTDQRQPQETAKHEGPCGCQELCAPHATC